MISPGLRRRYSGESESVCMPTEAAPLRSLRSLQRAQRACTRCADAGFIARAHPVFSGHAGQRILLVGQAPGPVEARSEQAFAGRAGRQLMRWLVRGGFRDEDDVRDRIYMTAMTTCFPGPPPGRCGGPAPRCGRGGALRTVARRRARVAPPAAHPPIGSLALERFLPGQRLDSVIGAAYTANGVPIHGAPHGAPVLVPLPTPRGRAGG